MCHSVKSWQASIHLKKIEPLRFSSLVITKDNWIMNSYMVGLKFRKGKLKFSMYHELFPRHLGQIKYKKTLDEQFQLKHSHTVPAEGQRDLKKLNFKSGKLLLSHGARIKTGGHFLFGNSHILFCSCIFFENFVSNFAQSLHINIRVGCVDIGVEKCIKPAV